MLDVKRVKWKIVERKIKDHMDEPVDQNNENVDKYYIDNEKKMHTIVKHAMKKAYQQKDSLFYQIQ